MNKKITIAIIVVSILLVAVIFLMSNTGNPSTTKIKSTFGIGPELTVSPTSGDFRVGQSFDAKVLVDTKNSTADAIDVYALNYDPKVLEVQDSDSQTDGVQFKKGDAFVNYLGTSIDKDKGKIIFSAVSAVDGPGFKGQGTLATITFKAIAPQSNAKLTFDFKAGATNDSNIASKGKDILSKVTNGGYNVR